jgi:hypothetical protein
MFLRKHWFAHIVSPESILKEDTTSRLTVTLCILVANLVAQSTKDVH